MSDLHLLCERESASILADRGWQLAASQREFVEQVVADVVGLQAESAHPPPLSNLVRLAIYRSYGAVLHSACMQQGTARQQRAFVELWHYLFPLAYLKLQETGRAEECAQNTIASVWEKVAQCREPQSFLAWTQMILTNQVREMLRGELSEMESQTRLTTGDEEHETDVPTRVPDAANPSPRLDDHAVRARLEEAIRVCLPRSLKQQRVIIELFLNERGLKETADLLGMSIGNVSVLRTRALDTLRNCEDFIHALEDWLDAPS